MKECPICKATMNKASYEYPSSSAERWLPRGGTLLLDGSINSPPKSSVVYIEYWKCPNCGYYLSEQTSDDSRGMLPSNC